MTTTKSHDIDHRTEDRPLIDWIFNEDGHRHHEFDPYSMAGDRVGFEGSLTRKSHTARELLLHGHSYTIASVEEGRESEQVHADSGKQEPGGV